MHKRVRSLALLCAVVLCLLTPAYAYAEGPKPAYTSLEELSNNTVGTVLGTTYDIDVQKLLNEDPEFRYYSEMSEMLMALKYDRIAACCLDKPVAQIAVERNSGLAIMPEDAGLDANAVALPKGSSLTPYVSKIVQRFVDDGTMRELEHEWCELEEDKRSLIKEDWGGTGGTLVIAVDDATEPMSYRDSDGNLRGLEVELALMIARELNMNAELRPMSFSAVMSALSTRDVDMAIAGISITDERADLYDLTPAYRSAVVTLVTRDVSETSANPLEWLSKTIRETFFKGSHGWLFFSGIVTTVGLAIASVTIGLTLGYLLGITIVLLSTPSIIAGYANKKRTIRHRLLGIVRIVALAFEKVMSEIPVVIVLFALRYLVFDFSSHFNTIVAIIGLALSLAATTSSILRSGIDAVDTQLWEIACATGYTPYQALKDLVLPMARSSYTPELHAAIVQTVFDTSVVGLIAVHDVTRIADLLRARTTEALPAMFATSAVYIILSSILRRILRAQVKRRKEREQIVTKQNP